MKFIMEIRDEEIENFAQIAQETGQQSTLSYLWNVFDHALENQLEAHGMDDPAKDGPISRFDLAEN